MNRFDQSINLDGAYLNFFSYIFFVDPFKCHKIRFYTLNLSLNFFYWALFELEVIFPSSNIIRLLT
jgi:hypothetical protein